MGQEPNGIDEARKGGDDAAKGGGDPEEAVRRLEERAQAIRGNLDVLVDEVERGGSRLMKPMVLGTGAAALVVLVVGGAAVWRGLRRRSRPSRLGGLTRALRRMIEHPERIAEVQPSPSKKVLASVGAAVASIAVHQLARVASAKLAGAKLAGAKLAGSNAPGSEDAAAGG
jgi:hypothetical protein